MRSDLTQLDLYRHSAPALAVAHRLAAEAARRNPFETPEAGERRAAHHEREAARLEAIDVPLRPG